jgi:hypothetical protein
MATAKAVLAPVPALDAAHHDDSAQPGQSTQVRTLGWYIPNSTASELYGRLYAAVASIGTVTLSSDCVACTIFVASIGCDACPGSGYRSTEPMTALLWVAPCSGGVCGHHVCIRRASGDTFAYHSFYRKVRQAMASATGWREELRRYQPESIAHAAAPCDAWSPAPAPTLVGSTPAVSFACEPQLWSSGFRSPQDAGVVYK